jgi:hypothetical protein
MVLIGILAACGSTQAAKKSSPVAVQVKLFEMKIECHLPRLWSACHTAGATWSVDYTFTKQNSGTLELACYLPGHYEAGMHQAITVQ